MLTRLCAFIDLGGRAAALDTVFSLSLKWKTALVLVIGHRCPQEVSRQGTSDQLDCDCVQAILLEMAYYTSPNFSKSDPFLRHAVRR